MASSRPWAGVESARMATQRQTLVCVLLLACAAAVAQVLPKPQIESAEGQPTPDFVLKDQHGKSFRLSSQRGKRVLLIFFRGHW